VVQVQGVLEDICSGEASFETGELDNPREFVIRVARMCTMYSAGECAR
jgi:hypothetical protein